ncbi:MAG: hypothetical protein ACI9LM_005335 [Alteromonadaceae bacterium]
MIIGTKEMFEFSLSRLTLSSGLSLGDKSLEIHIYFLYINK